MADIWCPFAIRRLPLGDAKEKHGGYVSPEPHRKAGIVCHSMEGSMVAALGELDKVTRRASWTFSNPKVGPLYQHFPLNYDTWASGSAEANQRYTSCEHEGKVGEPLNENQIANDVMLFRWLAEVQEWPGYRRGKELWEHKEAVAVYGGGATACPSDRIPWNEIIRRLENDEVTQADFNRIEAMIKASEVRQNEYVNEQNQQLLAFIVAIAKNLDGDTEAIKKQLGIG